MNIWRLLALLAPRKNHRFSYIVCSSVLDLARTWRCTSALDILRTWRCSSVLDMERTWRSWSCMSIAFSRLFLLSRLMSTWRPCTSLRFCVRISNSLLKVEKILATCISCWLKRKGSPDHVFPGFVVPCAECGACQKRVGRVTKRRVVAVIKVLVRS